MNTNTAAQVKTAKGKKSQPAPLPRRRPFHRLFRHSSLSDASPLFPLSYTLEGGTREDLLRNLAEVLEEVQGEMGYVSPVEEAIPLLVEMVPYYIIGLKERGRMPESLYVDMASAAWRILHGPKPPAAYPFSPELVMYFFSLVQTSRLLLLASRHRK